MSITIQEVNNLRDLRKFVNFPYDLYANDPHWVPSIRKNVLNTLNWDKNPAFEYCQAKYWLAYKDGKLAGRIAGIINPRFKERWKTPYARFGWFDFIDDEEVSSTLLNTVEAWAKQEGQQAIHGPFGFTNLDPEAMLVDGFDEVSTLAASFNYPYYPTHMEKAGYEKDIDYIEFEIKVPDKQVEKISKLSKLVAKRYKLHIPEQPTKRDLLRYAPQIFDLMADAYQNLFGVTPLSREQVDGYIQQYLGFIAPEYVPVVLNEDDKLVAFGIAMPSLSTAMQKNRGRLYPFGFIPVLRAMRKNDKADLYLVAVHPDYQGKGVNAMLITNLLGIFQEKGIKTVESNPEMEENYKVQAQWKYFEKRQHKRRRVYIKHF